MPISVQKQDKWWRSRKTFVNSTGSRRMLCLYMAAMKVTSTEQCLCFQNQIGKCKGPSILGPFFSSIVWQLFQDQAASAGWEGIAFKTNLVPVRIDFWLLTGFIEQSDLFRAQLPAYGGDILLQLRFVARAND